MAKKRQPTTAAAKDDEPLTPGSKNHQPLPSKKPDQPLPSKKPDQPPPSKKPAEEKVEEKDDEDSTSEEASSSEGEKEESSEEEQPPSKTTQTEKSGSKKQPASKTPQTEKSGSKEDEDEDETDTDSDSDSDNEPPSKLKSINSKSISKPEPNSSATPARSGTKRPAEDDSKQSKKKKKTATAVDDKKEQVEDNKKPGDEKKLFQRVFNDNDELAILKGLVDFIATGNDPFKYPTDFYDFVKRSISFPVTVEQLKDKVRRLKGKFETKMKSCKRGKTLTFSKPNEEEMFEYGKKVWGGNVAEENGKPDEKPSNKGAAVKKPDLQSVVSKETRKESPCLSLIDQFAGVSRVRFAGVSRVSEDFVKSGLELIEESDRIVLETRWNELQIAELKVVAMRAALVQEQARLLMDVLGSSSSH